MRGRGNKFKSYPTMFKFLFSRHRSTYIRLGWKHLVWPGRVYKLAHKGSGHTDLDKAILHDLLDLGLIHRRSTYNMDKYKA